ncbi:hypothetical protein AAC387_Pa08g0673 [Persea americana]|eukprot:TRINITY_DN505_c3_g1_i1.p1 TRINITY_DN505_c3_g1~~TRINITY_DN505_c3_g1_i1.p1  ORF type:complete len:250 (+),score=38.74 TRINITY_DN505_c3_g1_i1:202-951(+)
MTKEGIDPSGSGDGGTLDGCDLEKQENVENPAADSGGASSDRDSGDGGGLEAIDVATDRGEEGKVELVSSKEGGCLSRSDSYGEQCRICHQQTEEALMDIGCRCRGELSKTHRSCIDFWFYSRGSNKCEICQQVAANIPAPHSNPSKQVNYWAGGVEPAVGRLRFIQGERERGSFRTLWFAFLIVIGGLLLDVLISISLGVSALPLNVIIGILLLLGLGTLVRIALECCRGCISRRVDANINPGYHPSV